MIDLGHVFIILVPSSTPFFPFFSFFFREDEAGLFCSDLFFCSCQLCEMEHIWEEWIKFYKSSSNNIYLKK